MTVRLYAFTCGTLTSEFARLMEGGEGRITVPIPAFLIEHPKGRALFDTGLHPDCQRDPAARLGPRLAGLFDIAFQPGEEVSARLEAIGRDPGKIDVVINSHLHFDHVGGNALIPNATLLMQRRELDGGEVVLAADACYFCRTLRERRLPRNVYDRAAMLASLDRLAALEEGGARIFFGHDPEFWPK